MEDTKTTNDRPEKIRVGRPLKYSNVADLQRAIDTYFDDCDPHIAKKMTETGMKADGDTLFELRSVITEQKPYTMSGLAHALEISRQTLLDYGDRPEFLDTIETAREKVHRFAEEQLFGKAASGAAFSLKNNWGWKDKHDYDHTSDGKRIEAPAIYMSNIAPRDSTDAPTQTAE